MEIDGKQGYERALSYHLFVFFSFQRKGEQFQHETKLKGANFFSQNIFFKTHDPGVLHYGITENTEVL